MYLLLGIILMICWVIFSIWTINIAASVSDVFYHNISGVIIGFFILILVGVAPYAKDKYGVVKDLEISNYQYIELRDLSIQNPQTVGHAFMDSWKDQVITQDEYVNIKGLQHE